ncbi:MAG: glycosyltransferase [Clostridia bacterium]|nr:glycosyltransferase [Clostridia bacterium]
MNELDSRIKVIEYTPNDDKLIFVRKIKNLLKRIGFTLKYKNKFDFAASFATYSLVGSFVARTASKNSALWIHTNYLTYFNNDKNKVKEFFNMLNYTKFKHLVFVSKRAKEDFLKVFPIEKDKVEHCNNLIDYKKINYLSHDKIELEKEKNLPTFLNVGRHEELSKRLTRLIQVSSRLKKENFSFKVLLVGDGEDTKLYKELVEKENLQKEIIFLGRKQNPYPYFNIADCVILTSDYEGYPVVFLESMILNKPIITTKVSDYEEIEGKYGYTTDKTTEDIYEKMKLFITKGFEIKEKFDAESYNNEIIKKIESLV